MKDKGINYWENYYPVVQWMSVRKILTLLAIKRIHKKSIEFIFAYSQDDIDVDIYMDFPQDFNAGQNSGRYVLRIKKNIYSIKQAGHNPFESLSGAL